ncbi:MAG: HD domain-containing protein [Bacteroidaceae bacterium]|nr:HD domain-containing protein [Bacteroidaceae bacterium]
MQLLIRHSRDVADKALGIAKSHPEWQADLQFIEEAAMLHDIGIYLTDAPGIHCHGTEPYICHGILGARLLRKEGLPRHARVAERHTGAGLTAEDITSQGLPLPAKDFLPETIEERVICYADKFFSKSHPEREKTLESVLRSMAKFGEDSVERFKRMVGDG